MFRLSLGKPSLIPAGSWAVNFPDPTITGNDDPDTHVVQIHFLASMRQTLVMLKYLDNVDGLGETLDQKTADDLAMQIHMTIETWNPVFYCQSALEIFYHDLIEHRTSFLGRLPTMSIPGLRWIFS